MLAQRLDGRNPRSVECLQGACPEVAEVFAGRWLLRPEALRLFAQGQQPRDVRLAQACPQRQGQARQQMVEGFPQAADVRLRDGTAAGGPASGQFLLAERGTLLFVEGREAVHGEGALDKAELGRQVVLGETAEQRAGLIGPWLEHAVEVKEG